jgi:hypothetical protein
VLRFDPSGSYPASITRTAGDDGSVSLAFAIPPTSLSDLHIPAAVLGGTASERTRVEAHGELTIVAVQQTTTRAGDAGSGDGGTRDAGAGDASSRTPPPPAAITSRSASGRIVLSAAGLVIFGSGSPVDVSFDLPVSGDTSRPIPVAGLLAIAPADPSGAQSKVAASAALSGTLDLSAAMARLELTGKTGAIPCVKAAAAPGGGAPKEKEGTNGILASIGITLDDLPGARVSLQPLGTCTPKLR